jgi:hypothetical protein
MLSISTCGTRLRFVPKKGAGRRAATGAGARQGGKQAAAHLLMEEKRFDADSKRQ